MCGKLGANPRKTQTVNFRPAGIVDSWQRRASKSQHCCFPVTRCVGFRGDMLTREAPSLPHTNEAIASFVTAGAKLHLFGYLDKLKEHALY